jgi:hypothetical protein
MLLRLPYLALTSVFALIRLLPMSDMSIPWNRGGLRYAAWTSRPRAIERS